MPLTPETFINYNQPVVDVFVELEEEALTILTKEFSKDLDLDNMNDWRARKVMNLRKVNRSFAADVAAAETDDVIAESLTKSYRAGIVDTDADINSAIKAGAKVAQVSTTAEQFGIINVPRLADAVLSAQDAMNGQKTNMLSAFPRVYQNVINDSVLLQQSGVLTLDQAVQRTLDKWADKGIPSLVDKQGKTWNARTYSENYMRTESTATYRAAGEARQLEYGEVLVQISTHVDCSDICRPYQGNVYIIEGTSSRYKPLEDAIDGGLYHNNCKHYQRTYFPGISDRFEKYTAADLDAAYKDLNRQRAIERNIKKWKNRKITALDEVAYNKAQKKVSFWQKEMRGFIDDTGRTRRYSREKI